MPNYDDNTQRGNLYITVDVEFPRGTFSDEDEEGMEREREGGGEGKGGREGGRE